MRVGSIVEAQHSFDDVREAWGIDYPRKGDLLRVLGIRPHHKWGRVNLLTLDGCPVEVCDRMVNGGPNFLEVLTPEENEAAESSVLEIKKQLAWIGQQESSL
jgi:hypothetical protein